MPNNFFSSLVKDLGDVVTQSASKAFNTINQAQSWADNPMGLMKGIRSVNLPTDAMPVFKSHTGATVKTCLLYTSPSPRDLSTSRMPSSA